MSFCSVNPKPTFPYPEEHTVCFEYLGESFPEPNWERWLSPFHHKAPQNAFCRGLIVKTESPDLPYFLWNLSRAVKRRLSRGYRVGVLTPNHKFYTKVSLKYTKEDQEVSGSYSMTFEDAGHGYWESCGFDWGKTFYLDIWILLQRRPDQPICSTSITFLIQALTPETYSHPVCRHFPESKWDHPYLKNVWPRFSAAVNKYNEKYQKRYGEPLPEDIINDFRANFRYNILFPFRETVYRHWAFDFCRFIFGENHRFSINDNQQLKLSANFSNSKVVTDPKFVDSYIKKLQTSQMIGSNLSIKPWAEWIWMNLQGLLNSNFEEINVENWDVMFGNPTQQDDFSEGNAPEVPSVAISGNSRSNDPIAIDPAIETTYAGFLGSVRDLPFKLNRWCQVVRRESKPIPFIRSFQFPCQKAYGAFSTRMEADLEILQILELLRYFFEKILAVPTIKCKTSKSGKFAVEAFLPNVVWFVGERSKSLEGACSIRGATAHCLGQNGLENFNKNGEKATAWLNSWSCSIRVIGLMVMVHGNENSLVLPPKVAPKQVIVTSRLNIRDQRILDACNCVVDMLCEAGIRASADLDDFPLSKMCWEDKGVPLLIKVGPEVCNLDQVEAHRRDNKEIIFLSMTSTVEKVKEILDEIQKSLFEAAKGRQDACIQIAKNWDEFVEAVHNMRVILAPWCDDEIVEKDVKAELEFMRHGHGVKILCSPLEHPEITEDTKCFASGKPAKKWTYWGRNLFDFI